MINNQPIQFPHVTVTKIVGSTLAWTSGDARHFLWLVQQGSVQNSCSMPHIFICYPLHKLPQHQLGIYLMVIGTISPET